MSRGRSSVGQSRGLIIPWALVRVQPAPHRKAPVIRGLSLFSARAFAAFCTGGTTKGQHGALTGPPRPLARPVAARTANEPGGGGPHPGRAAKIATVPRVLATELIDPDFGLRHTQAFVSEGRFCRVQVFDRQDLMEPTLINRPLGGSEAADLPVIGLGEHFQIDGQPGEFRTERLVADSDALVIERVS
jgi:hypothetical protein